jgi:phosphoglycerate dehydrogenase-like enzyme
MNGALRVGGIVGGGYVGTSVLTVLETFGMPVLKVREVLVVRSGMSVVERDDEDVDVRVGVVEVVVGLARGVVVWVVRVCCRSVVVG